MCSGNGLGEGQRGPKTQLHSKIICQPREWQENKPTPWAPCTVHARKYNPEAGKIQHLEFRVIRSFIHSMNAHRTRNILCLATGSPVSGPQPVLPLALSASALGLVFRSSALQLLSCSCFHLQSYLWASSYARLSSKVTSSECFLWTPHLG